MRLKKDPYFLLFWIIQEKPNIEIESIVTTSVRHGLFTILNEINYINFVYQFLFCIETANKHNMDRI